MKIKKTIFATVFSMGFFAITSANAAPIIINEVIDLSGSVIRNDGWGDYINRIYSFVAPVQIGNGDNVDMTIMFSAGQSIQMTDLGQGNGSWNFGWLSQDSFIDPPNTSSFTIDNSYVDLLDAQGNVLRSVTMGTVTTGLAHIGPDAEGFLNPYESLLISGYHTYFDVVSIQNNPSHYCGPWFYLGADQLQLNGAGTGTGVTGCGGGSGQPPVVTVAEPTTYTMLLAGLGLLGFAAKRREEEI